MNALTSSPARGRRGPVALALFAGIAAGCVTTTAVPLGAETYPARPADHTVPVYDTVEDLPQPWVKVARLHAHDVLFGDVLAELQTQARQLGGDALVLAQPPWFARCADLDDWWVLVVRWK